MLTSTQNAMRSLRKKRGRFWDGIWLLILIYFCMVKYIFYLNNNFKCRVSCLCSKLSVIDVSEPIYILIYCKYWFLSRLFWRPIGRGLHLMREDIYYVQNSLTQWLPGLNASQNKELRMEDMRYNCDMYLSVYGSNFIFVEILIWHVKYARVASNMFSFSNTISRVRCFTIEEHEGKIIVRLLEMMCKPSIKANSMLAIEKCDWNKCC